MRGMVWLFGSQKRKKLGRRIRDSKDRRSPNMNRCESADANITLVQK